MTASAQTAGSSQTWAAGRYETHARFVSDLGGPILGWLDPKPGERILDLGCGDGALSAEIAKSGAELVGVDASEPLLEAARARGLDARFMDGQALEFDGEFDAVFSNAALHWMQRPADVARGVRRALRARGRFVAEFGGHGNVAAVITAMRAAARARNGDEAIAGPWYYPTPDEYKALLEAEGFKVARIELVPRPTPLPTGMANWLLTFRKPFFDQFGEDGGCEVLDEVVDILKPSLCDSDGQWTADYVRLRVEAHAV